MLTQHNLLQVLLKPGMMVCTYSHSTQETEVRGPQGHPGLQAAGGQPGKQETLSEIYTEKTPKLAQPHAFSPNPTSFNKMSHLLLPVKACLKTGAPFS